jgi:hypothetical protein
MRYKIGDRIKIRTWENMMKEYGSFPDGKEIMLDSPLYFASEVEEEINKNFPDRILTVLSAVSGFYTMEKTIHAFTDEMIEGLVE